MKQRVDLHKILRPNGKYNSCTSFLLPSIGLKVPEFSLNGLQVLGFVNTYLHNYTKGYENYKKDCLLLLFNPSISFFEEKWQFFEELIKRKENFKEIIEFDYCIFGIWLGIENKHLPNLRWYYKKGFYSHFPKSMHSILLDEYGKIVKVDEVYRRSVEKKLGLEEDSLIGVELASIPEKEEYCLDLTELIKKKE